MNKLNRALLTLLVFIIPPAFIYAAVRLLSDFPLLAGVSIGILALLWLIISILIASAIIDMQNKKK